MAEVEIGGVRVYYERHGSRQPLVLVHGLGGTGEAVWRKVVPELALEHGVVLYDLRGSGRSEVPPGPYSLEQFVADLDGLLDHLALESAALLGHSFGGSIALEYAAVHPGRVRGLVAVGAPSEFPDATRAALRARADTVEAEGMAAVAETVARNGTAPSFQEAHPEELQALIEMLEGNDPRGYAAQCRVIADLRITGHLSAIAAPTLLLAGDRDGVAPPAANEASAALIPDARYRQVEDCGHILPWEKPDALLDAVARFLA